MQRVTQRLHELRLAQPRNTLEQDVTARKDRHQHIVDDVAVSDDNLGDLSADPLEFALKGLQVLVIQLRDHMDRDYTAGKPSQWKIRGMGDFYHPEANLS